VVSKPKNTKSGIKDDRDRKWKKPLIGTSTIMLGSWLGKKYEDM
jgi:hypothetical protein